MEWVAKRIIIYHTELLSQVDFYILQVLSYELDNCNRHIIIVQCYYYEIKFEINLLKHQFLDALLITMQDLLLILCWHLGHAKVNLTEYHFFADYKKQRTSLHFPLKSQSAF